MRLPGVLVARVSRTEGIRIEVSRTVNMTAGRDALCIRPLGSRRASAWNIDGRESAIGIDVPMVAAIEVVRPHHLATGPYCGDRFNVAGGQIAGQADGRNSAVGIDKTLGMPRCIRINAACDIVGSDQGDGIQGAV